MNKLDTIRLNKDDSYQDFSPKNAIRMQDPATRGSVQVIKTEVVTKKSSRVNKNNKKNNKRDSSTMKYDEEEQIKSVY